MSVMVVAYGLLDAYTKLLQKQLPELKISTSELPKKIIRKRDGAT